MIISWRLSNNDVDVRSRLQDRLEANYGGIRCLASRFEQNTNTNTAPER